MTEDKKKIVITRNRKMLMRNIVFTPLVLLRIILMLPVLLIYKIGEYSGYILNWLDYKLPGWNSYDKISYTSSKLQDFGLTKEKENNG